MVLLELIADRSAVDCEPVAGKYRFTVKMADFDQLLPAQIPDAVTASAMAGDSDRCLEAEFDGYFPKPIDPERFAAEIDGLLAAAGHGDAAPEAG